MALTLTVAQMAAAQMPTDFSTPSTQYLLGDSYTPEAQGKFLTGSMYRYESSFTSFPSPLVKFYLAAGQSYLIWPVATGSTSMPALYDPTGISVPLTLSPADYYLGINYVPTVSGYYYSDMELPPSAKSTPLALVIQNIQFRDLPTLLAAGPQSYDVQGTPGADTLTGVPGTDLLWGHGGNDTFKNVGWHTVIGGDGVDTVVMPYYATYYSLLRDASNGVVTITHFTKIIVGGMQLTQPAEVTTLVGVERIQFSDSKVAIDVDGAGGQAYRLYQAALGRKPDPAGLGVQMHALDAGTSLQTLAQNFISSTEFSNKYGALGNGAFVTQLYANVLHRAPDAGGLAAWQGNLDHGTMSRADVLVGFSESAENQAALIGTISQGMVYTG